MLPTGFAGMSCAALAPCACRPDLTTTFPDDLLVLGDAFCCFNPIYGQGMTVSALQAVALDELMRNPAARRNSFGLPRRFHDTIAKLVDAPWQLTTWEDFR